jgi:hypothetical protein
MSHPSIDELADDFAQRNDTSVQHDLQQPLPEFAPLSHETLYLSPSTNPVFDVDRFLLSRASHSSLPELRAELREYQAKLKSELVQLINDDYESFISLSTDLRGEGARLERIKFPLNGIRAEIAVRFAFLAFYTQHLLCKISSGC